ncbi:MAG: hypothetical protein CMF36_08575 [Leeuwenhoekiella sp.]|nr:hypothetical protein [Leeuwenhoekiella sp.]
MNKKNPKFKQRQG